VCFRKHLSRSGLREQGVKVMKEFSAARIVPMSEETMTLWVLWLSIFVGLFFNLYGPGGDRG